MENRTRITLADMVDERFEVSERVDRVLKGFAKRKPWRGKFDERFGKFRDMVRKLYKALGSAGEVWELVHVGPMTGPSTRSQLRPRLKRITLTGRLSVITTLFLVARSRGVEPLGSYCFAVTLFARYFPRSFSRCELRGGLVVNTRTHEE